AVCHGADMTGAMPGVPNLVGVGQRMADDAIKAVITGGRGLMRPFPDMSQADQDAVVTFLTNPAGGRGARGGAAVGGRGAGGPAGPALPPGPVVARGGVTLPELPGGGRGGRGAAAPGAPTFGGAGPTGGNAPYPADAKDVPTVRYATGYNVM